MACFYSLIQYVPDVLAEERITFGVVVYWQRGVASRFVKNWGRIRAVAGGGDIDFLRGFAGRFESEFVSRTYIDIPDAGPLGETLIHKLSRDWHHSIQLTRPRASMAAPQRLIDQLSERALGSAWRQPRRASKASIIDDATALLRNELTAQTGRDFYDAVRTSEHLNGKV
jgi:hypothetical protein